MPVPAGWERVATERLAVIRMAEPPEGTGAPTVSATRQPLDAVPGTGPWVDWVGDALATTAGQLPNGLIADAEHGEGDSWGLIDFVGDRGPVTVVQRFVPDGSGAGVLIVTGVTDKGSWPDRAPLLRAILEGTHLAEGT